MFVCCVRCHWCHYSTPGVRVIVKMWQSSEEDSQSPTRTWRKNGLVENKFSVSERKQLWAIVHGTGILSCHSSLPFINATHTLSSERWMIYLRTFNWYSVIKSNQTVFPWDYLVRGKKSSNGCLWNWTWI